MSKPLIYRQTRYFKINIDELPTEARNTPTVNALYAFVYTEFKGANENPKYKSLTYEERMKALNDSAKEWLKKRGFK